MIAMDHSGATGGIQAIRDATQEFDQVAASNNPKSIDAGAAQALLADVLATSADVALRLVYELDTLANLAEEGIEDLRSFTASSSAVLDGLGWSLP